MFSGTRTRVGFKSKKQGPLFMIWKEDVERDEVVNAWVVFDSVRWFGI